MTPLFQMIRNDVKAKIMSGEWPPGTKIPVEHQLMLTYNCSRMTVSKALSELASRGLLIRRKSAGSVVGVPRAERAVLEIRDFAKEAAKLGVAYSHDVISRKATMATSETAKRLGLRYKSKIVEVVTLHMLAGKPEAYEERLINVAAVKAVAKESFIDLPPGSWLLKHVPWSSAEHAIEAVNADKTISALLGIKLRTAKNVATRYAYH